MTLNKVISKMHYKKVHILYAKGNKRRNSLPT